MTTTPGVPRERVLYLAEALKKALQDEELIKKARTTGQEVIPGSAEEVRKFLMSWLEISEEDKALFGKMLGVKGY
jgi:tripartite-type tricarboxylate transporter receptor subunit TctC